MPGRVRTTAIILPLFVLVLASASVQAQAKAEFNLPSQPLADSLKAVGAQTNTNVLVETELVGERQAPALQATLTLDEALSQLLAGSGITYKFLNEKTIVVAAVKPSSPTGQPAGAAPGDRGSKSIPPGQRRSFLDRFRLAQTDSASTSTENTPAVLTSSEPTMLEEIVVTAQKKEERLREVPVPVTALDAAALVDGNQLRLKDYYTQIPGLSVTPADGFGAPTLSIRGLTTGSSITPTVGVTVDDVPYGSSTAIGVGYQVPDFDPGELQRVEVLRGPQGTLYGASSIGGLLKFVTVDPSTSGLAGNLQGGLSSVQDGNDVGYNLRGSINVPLNERAAVRASAFTRRDAGYVDNIQTGKRDVNREEVRGGRLSALWRPSDFFSLKLSALLQDSTLHGSADVYVPTAGFPQTAGLQDLQQNALRGTGRIDKKDQAYSATLTFNFGRAALTALSGYNVSRFESPLDYSTYYSDLMLNGIPVLGFNGYGVSGASFPSLFKTRKFSQEIRLSTALGARTEWLIGAFYDHEDSDVVTRLLAVDPASGAAAGEFLFNTNPSTYSEYAAFTDLTFKISDRFDIQLGARDSNNRQAYSQLYSGPYAALFLGASPSVTDQVRTRDNAFTYLLTPRFRMSEDLMVYMRLASGYRPGGPNVNAALLGLPSSYQPDKTRNYEVGLKGSALDHRLAFDASVYYIDWKNIQLSLFDQTTNLSYLANGSAAKSQGVELSIEARPTPGLRVAAWGAWNDAVLTRDLPPSAAQGDSGDRLPSSSRISGNLAVDQDFPLWNGMTGFVGGSISYVGDSRGPFASFFAPGPDRQDFPGYAKTDLRAGARFDSWRVNLFVNNVTDKRAALTGGLGAFLPFAFTYIQPRTIGVSLATTF